MEIKETCYRGTRILLGESATNKLDMLYSMRKIVELEGFTPIIIPIIQYQEIFASKVGEENNNLMFNFKDRGDRDICLAPEYTAVIQRLSSTTFKNHRDLKLYYIQECFRGERPQSGRYRQFTQFGIEILNPTKDYIEYLCSLAQKMIEISTGSKDLIVNKDAIRGLDYYKEGRGFEISCNRLGSQKQICGGGEYEGGVGFALGIDRLMLL